MSHTTEHTWKAFSICHLFCIFEQEEWGTRVSLTGEML